MHPKLHLDPAIIDQVHSLEWLARKLARGLFLGKHISRQRGSGMEFDQFRPYTQGDDLRLLDWKMYARTGKYFIRESNVEVNHKLNIHIDNSLSMTYAENGLSKLQLSKVITATLTYVMAVQSDQFNWGTNDFQFPQSQGLKSWRRSLLALNELTPGDSDNHFTNTYEGIHLWISDLYIDLTEIEKKIDSMLGPFNEVIIFQLLGRKEVDLDFNSNTKFIDLETSEEMQVDPHKYSSHYKKALNTHFESINRLCLSKGVIYRRIFLQDSIPDMLREFLNQYNYLSAL